MKKHSSTGNIYDFNISPQYNQMKERFSINSSKNYDRQNSKKLRLLFTSNFDINRLPSPSPQTTKISNYSLSSKNHPQLYEELMSLKKK